MWNALKRRALDIFIWTLVAAMAILVAVTVYITSDEQTEAGQAPRSCPAPHPEASISP